MGVPDWEGRYAKPAFEQLEPRLLLNGTVQGAVWEDINAADTITSQMDIYSLPGIEPGPSASHDVEQLGRGKKSWLAPMEWTKPLLWVFILMIPSVLHVNEIP